MISIIIPVYNQADKIGECLDSILGQSYLEKGKIEVVLVDDGSADGIKAVADRYLPLFNAVGAIFKFISQDNQGANPARNRGAAEASGEFIIFCDADIIMDMDMLQSMSEALEKNPSAAYAYSSFRWGRKLFRLWPFDEKRLRLMPYIHTTSLIRRKFFPGFDDRIKKFQDWDLWLAMLGKGHRGVWVDKVLYRVRTGGTISSWLPSFSYRLFPFLPQVKKYNQAMRIIREKHKLK